MKKRLTILTAISLSLVCSLVFAPSIGAHDQTSLVKPPKVKAYTDDPRA
ncbi:hypothetical protein [Brevibacillus sp. SAFN-007a]